MSHTCSKTFQITAKTVTPLAYWKMEEAGGADRVDVINAIHLVPVVTVPLFGGFATIGNAAGKVLQAVQFSAANSGFPFFNPYSLVMGANPAGEPALKYQGKGLHLTGWFKATDLNTTHSIFSYDLGGGCSFILTHTHQTIFPFAPISTLQLSRPGVTTLTVTPFNLADGSFHFISAFFDLTNLLLGMQFDGGVINTVPVAGGLVGFNPVHAFFQMDTAPHVAGSDSTTTTLWDEWAIWGDKLTDPQVANIYNGGAGKTWPF